MSLVAEQRQFETVTFSSTYIRACVDAGDGVAAAEALGRAHRVGGAGTRSVVVIRPATFAERGVLMV